MIPLLTLKDQYQRIRLEALLGFPQLLIEDTNDRHNFPIFGYNRLSTNRHKWLEIKTITNITSYQAPSIISKVYSIHHNEKAISEIFLKLLEASLTSPELLKYIRFIPREEPGNKGEDYIVGSISSITNLSSQGYTSYKATLDPIVLEINKILKSVLSNHNILNNMTQLSANYLPGEVKREEVSVISNQDDLLILKQEYFTTSVSINENTKYNPRNNIYGSIYQDEDDFKEIDESDNMGSGNNIIVIDSKQRGNDANFYNKVLNLLKSGKKIVVENKYKVENYFSTVIRYVAINCKIFF